MKTINSRFNEELQQQIEGTLPKGHVYQLGMPGKILLKAGVKDLPIELAAKTIEDKSSPDYINKHPFDLTEIKNLPQAIQNPIMIFDSNTRKGSKVILTELENNGVNFIAAMQMNYPSNNAIKINSIRSLYPKDQLSKAIVNWHSKGLLRYVDKEKALAFTNQLQSNSADVVDKAKASIYNIINNFEKSKGWVNFSKIFSYITRKIFGK